MRTLYNLPIHADKVFSNINSKDAITDDKLLIFYCRVLRK